MFNINRESPLYISLYYKLYWWPRYGKIRHILEAYSRITKKGFFIQIGTNKEIGEPLHSFIIRHDWKGILIEPNKQVFDVMSKKYVEKGFICENLAISNKDEFRDFYYVEPDDAYEYPELKTYSKKVECITYLDLLKRHSIETVDILQIDTEGFDYEIIKSIDFNISRPQVLIFEHRHLSKNNYRDCIKLLEYHGYYTFKAEYDVVACRSQIFKYLKDI